MSIETSFREKAAHTPTTIEGWKARALSEVHEKEKRLLEFYEKRNWETAKLTYSYLREYKPDEYLRKNGYLPGIIHELNICLMLKALVEGKYLPECVTEQIDDLGNIHTVPDKYGALQNLFNVAHIHDIDEDFYETSPTQMLEWLNKKITKGPYDLDSMAQYMLEVDFLPELQRAITFGRKTFDESGNPIKIPTHNGDPQNYFDALQKNWATMFLKAVDATYGIVDRYAAAPNVFSLAQQRQYLDEKQDLFYYRRPMENMSKEYPELAEAIDIINARMNIAYRATSMIVSFHPENKSERKTGNPATAVLDIRDFLHDAIKISPHLHPDDDDLIMLVRNLEFVSSRRPELSGITGQLRKQIESALPALKKYPPIPGLPLPEDTQKAGWDNAEAHSVFRNPAPQ